MTPAAVEVTCIRHRACHVHSTSGCIYTCNSGAMIPEFYSSSSPALRRSSSCAASLGRCFSSVFCLHYFFLAIYVACDSAWASMLHLESFIAFGRSFEFISFVSASTSMMDVSIQRISSGNPSLGSSSSSLSSSNHNCLRPIDSLLPSTFPRLLPLRWSPRDLQSVNYKCLRGDLVFCSQLSNDSRLPCMSVKIALILSPSSTTDLIANVSAWSVFLHTLRKIVD